MSVYAYGASARSGVIHRRGVVASAVASAAAARSGGDPHPGHQQWHQQRHPHKACPYWWRHCSLSVSRQFLCRRYSSVTAEAPLGPSGGRDDDDSVEDSDSDSDRRGDNATARVSGKSTIGGGGGNGRVPRGRKERRDSVTQSILREREAHLLRVDQWVAGASGGGLHWPGPGLDAEGGSSSGGGGSDRDAGTRTAGDPVSAVLRRIRELGLGERRRRRGVYSQVAFGAASPTGSSTSSAVRNTLTGAGMLYTRYTLSRVADVVMLLFCGFDLTLSGHVCIFCVLYCAVCQAGSPCT